MRIGIDFDNTIACYDGVFHKAALERGLIPADLSPSKNAVRDYLNGSGRKDEFTLLQGYVYGARMDLVSPYPGLTEFLNKAKLGGHQVFIISHKTKNPILGPAYDMHAAARNFLESKKLTGSSGVMPKDIYFELTKEEKIARIKALGCELFIDDLPEILSMLDISIGVRRILFDPTGDYETGNTNFAIERKSSWTEISSLILGNTALSEKVALYE